MGINIIKKKTKEMYVSVNYDDSNIIINNTQLKTSIKIDLENNLPKVYISIKGEGKLVEVIGNINLKDDKVINSLNRKLNSKIEEIVESGIRIAFNNKTDVFGFGLKFYQEYPDYYNKIKNNWENELTKIKININSNVNLKTKGSSQISLEDNNDKKEN